MLVRAASNIIPLAKILAESMAAREDCQFWFLKQFTAF